jgi:hypothetical protein
VRSRNLRPPAESESILVVEARLGHQLPSSFRAFLQVADGGFLGDARIFGTIELSYRLPAGIPRKVIPFHPVGEGFECLDLRGKPSLWIEAPVVWWDPRFGVATTYDDFTDWLLDQLQELAGV